MRNRRKKDDELKVTPFMVVETFGITIVIVAALAFSMSVLQQLFF